MPVKTAKKSLGATRRAIRRHWSDQEKLRRREMAQLMQQRLLHSMRLAGAAQGAAGPRV